MGAAPTPSPSPPAPNPRTQLRTRTKSLFSLMKKMVRLSKQGKQTGQVFDLLGMRAVVQPREDIPPDQVGAGRLWQCHRQSVCRRGAGQWTNKQGKQGRARHPTG